MGALGFSQAPSCLKAPHPQPGHGERAPSLCFCHPWSPPTVGKGLCTQEAEPILFLMQAGQSWVLGASVSRAAQELPSFAHTVAPVLLEAVKEMLLTQEVPPSPDCQRGRRTMKVKAQGRGPISQAKVFSWPVGAQVWPHPRVRTQHLLSLDLGKRTFKLF